MKIGIITLYLNNKNFGGILQAFALQKVISEFGIQCEQLCYKQTESSLKQKIKTGSQYRSLSQNILLVIKKVSAVLLRKITASSIDGLTRNRTHRFNEFEKMIPHSHEVYDVSNIKKAVEVYDGFVAGSDQVWNGGVDLPAYTLGFVPESKIKISYAASSAGSFYGKWQTEVLKKNLDKMSAISVRENSLKTKLESITNKSVDLVLDPTLLLSRDQWECIAETPAIDEKYILCYFLGDSRKNRKTAASIAKMYNAKILTFPYIIGNTFRICDRSFGDIRDFSSGPKEFLGLIKNAEAVCTDSFHAVVFSVVFQKEFFAFPRFKEKSGSSNNRLTDFMAELNLQDRMLQDEQIPHMQAIDYNEVDSISSNMRKDSINWLKKSLHCSSESFYD